MKRVSYFLMCLSLFFVTNAKTYSGVCGDNVTWSFDDLTGMLAVIGTGDMYDYYLPENRPWESFNWNIKEVTISDGVTHLGRYSFEGLNIKNLVFQIV